MKDFQLSVVEEMESRDSSIAEVFMLCPVGEHGKACTVLLRMTVPCLKKAEGLSYSVHPCISH